MLMTIELKSETFKYQFDFIEYLASLEKFSSNETPLSESLKNVKINRIETYQSSYLGRITTNLADTLFEECANLFGRELVSRILADFFKHKPPTAENLIHAPNEISTYLRNRTDTKESMLFADLADICIRRWEILTGPDPIAFQPTAQTSFSELFLIPSADFVSPCAHHDLYHCWNEAQFASEVLAEKVFEEQRGVLLAKTSPTNFSVIAISPLLAPLVESMVQGSSLEQALERLTEGSAVRAEHLLTAELQDLITTFVSSNVLTASSRQ